MKRIINDNRGVTLIWVICLMVVIFIIGISVISAATISSGVAFRYRAAKSCYYFSKALSNTITKDIEGFSIMDGDPWCDIAQSVYDVKIEDINGTAKIANPSLNIDVSQMTKQHDNASAEIDIILMDQKIKKVPYIITKPGTGSPGDDGYVPPEDEYREKAKVEFVMFIKLRTLINNQEYCVYLKYQFDGETSGVASENADSAVINSGKYRFLGCFDSI